MTMRHFTILGKSNFTLSIICDILSEMFGRNYRLTIVSNIPDEENESLKFSFLTDDIDVEYLYHTEWKPSLSDQYILGVMGNSRKKVADFFLDKMSVDKSLFVNLIHPSSIIPKTTLSGTGILIGPSVTLAPFVKVGDFVHINRCVSIGHHTVLSSVSRINAGSTILGLCYIGEDVTVGPGCVILDKITIGDHSVIGAASMVNKNIPSSVMAYGSPAQIIRKIHAA